MKVRVLFFSVLRDITGTDEVEWELPATAVLTDLLNEVEARWPRLRDWAGSMLLAVDQTYVKRGDASALHDGAEVALMPPVQGG